MDDYEVILRIIFYEHLMLILKYFISKIIPDIPLWVKNKYDSEIASKEHFKNIG
jgi:hypothetical protein